MNVSICVTDDDYEQWRSVRMTVVPSERCQTVAEMRAQDSSDRLLLLASLDGTVVGSGIGDRSDTSGGFAMPRVMPEHRRRGVGSVLLRALAEHCSGLGMDDLRSSVDDEGSLAFATRFGFVVHPDPRKAKSPRRPVADGVVASLPPRDSRSRPISPPPEWPSISARCSS